jgi:hypothetical protein
MGVPPFQETNQFSELHYFTPAQLLRHVSQVFGQTSWANAGWIWLVATTSKVRKFCESQDHHPI